ncbi:MAG TPA: peptidase M14 [Planctomycetota bacterium]|nr:peptidase M14 [Planctomycetota bacterium]
MSIQIDHDFPGGNIVVEKIDGDEIWLRQDLRDTVGNWFYWAFRLRLSSAEADSARTLKIHFTGSRVIGTRGPSVSTDRGNSWHWLGTGCVQENSFLYQTIPAVAEYRFAMGLPYVGSNLREFLATRKSHPNLAVETLCSDRSGRPIERLRLGKLYGEPRFRLLLTARHHCCETTPNFVLEGLIDAALADEDLGRWFRTSMEAWIIPFMDKDGVEAGDQGKNRSPHDHNRDYVGTPGLYPAVRALREQVPAWSQGLLRVALDLHCPGIRGLWHEHIYFVGTENTANWDAVTAFSRILERVRCSPLPFATAENLPFGTAWNTGSPPSLMSFSRWAESLPGMRMATSFEIPYANCKEVTVTPEAARAFGRDLLWALQEYLEQPV